MFTKYHLKSMAVLLLVATWSACSKMSGPAALFKKLSPHDAYGQKLKDAGLANTAIGGSWLTSAAASISKPLSIALPYKEAGYFPADKADAAALRLTSKRGEKIHITLIKNPAAEFKIFLDLFRLNEQNEPELVASADTTDTHLDYEVKKAGSYILRLQPELLKGSSYTLTITLGPSLNFPVSMVGKPKIESFWGDSRDNGGRRHEGIDIFAPKGTPAIAAANGTVTSVSENKLGGLVVFMRPDEEDYVLYYAHLGRQLVHDGQIVKTGDTVGLIDNTGNAKYTPSHLHFGIYTNGGAIDPFPFVNRQISEPSQISASIDILNATARTSSNTKLYVSPDKGSAPLSTLPMHTAFTINAATDDWYKVTLPDGEAGYVSSGPVNKVSALRSISLKTTQPLFDRPDSVLAATKATIAVGNKVQVMGTFKNYYLVDVDGETGWIRL
jgi:murein DD-endopeptidase MepM/ murein hydrolase activator NlpD